MKIMLSCNPKGDFKVCIIEAGFHRLTKLHGLRVHENFMKIQIVTNFGSVDI